MASCSPRHSTRAVGSVGKLTMRMLVQSIGRAAIEYPAGRTILAGTLVPVEVRAETPTDRALVRSIHLAAFGDHGEVVANLVDDLRDPVARGEGLSLVAEVEERLIGHVMFTPSMLDAPRCLVPVQVLSPIGVLPECREAGIGTALIRRGVELLSEFWYRWSFSKGHPPTTRATGSSRRQNTGFRKPSLRIPDAAFQVLRLPAYAPWMTGTLVYSETFWRNDVVGLREPDA